MLNRGNSENANSGNNREAAHTDAVGYAPAPATLTAEQKKTLLDLARRTLASVAAGGSLVELSASELPGRLGEMQACFVTFKKASALRGCMGNLIAADPLHRAVAENTRNAALRDPRFGAVSPDEVDQLRIEISVLTEPAPLPFTSPEDLLGKLRPGDGVVLRIGGRASTFLPQVWDHIPDKVQFLDHLSRKAGCEPSAWRGGDVSVSVYHVQSFEEEPGENPSPPFHRPG